MNRVVSILLTFFLLASHINLTIGTHFCRGQAVETKILFAESHLDCGMADMEEACDAAGDRGFSYTNPPCCENQYQELQATDDFVRDAAEVILHEGAAAGMTTPVSNDVIFGKRAAQAYTDYLPPPMVKDIHSLFQTFRI
ncbi:MAG: hypothetical protein P1P83_11930 [Bacteroidales bacterium]|nr:hypothetical protein [Bacteroidales bacterium]MDT8374616.1 hypothetical protein [Bacteroidales bacterium]